MSKLIEMLFKIKTDEEAFEELEEKTKDMPQDVQDKAILQLGMIHILQRVTAAGIRNSIRKKAVEESMESAAL